MSDRDYTFEEDAKARGLLGKAKQYLFEQKYKATLAALGPQLEKNIEAITEDMSGVLDEIDNMPTSQKNHHLPNNECSTEYVPRLADNPDEIGR